jgi:antitoxin CptB
MLACGQRRRNVACVNSAADIRAEDLYINPAPGTRRVFGVGVRQLSVNSGGPEISSEGLDPRRRRLLFRSWHRGIREMDVVYGRFADAQIGALSEAELDDFEKLLELRDQQVFDWVFGTRPIDAAFDTPLFRRLLAFHDNGKTIK